MTRAVIDSSVITAILKSEQIDDQAYAIVDGGIMSAVNVADVYGNLRKLPGPVANAVSEIDRLLKTLSRVEPFTAIQARTAGLLKEPTRHAGLSLGDRACFALAMTIGAEIYTVDTIWANVQLNIPVNVLR